MSEPQRDYNSHNIPGQPFGSKVIVTSKYASIDPPQPKNHTRSRELVEVRNGTDSKSSTTRSPHMLTDELSLLTGELSSLTDELSFLTGELSSLTGKLSSLTGKPHTRTDELRAHATDELCSRTANLYSRTVELYSRIDELKEKNLAFQKQAKTTRQLNSASVSTIDPLDAMERDTSHSDEFKINVRLLKFFAEEASQELQKLKGDDFGDVGFFDDANWPFE
jgi:predicted RNase H-like nuclease (RuvC/YqgF family)